MCVCGNKMLWLLCGGKYKFLLRSAWIVLATTTLIDVSAIIAYWQLAPKSLDSKPGLKLSLLLLVAVLFLYFFAVLLSCFIIIKLSPKKRESSRESTVLHGVINDNAVRFGPLSQFSMPYLDGIRRALPNNLPPPPPPHRNSHGPISTEIQNSANRHSNITENTATSSIQTWNSHIIDESRLSNGQRRQRLDQAANLPAIVVTGPEQPVPIYENLQTQLHQFSTRVQRTSSSTESADGEFQYRSANLPRSHFCLPNVTRSLAVARSNSKMSVAGSSSNNSSNRPVSSESFSSNRSVAYQRYEDERQTLNKSTNQNILDSRSVRKSISVEPVSSKSESAISIHNANQHHASCKQTLDMPMRQAKFESRVNNFNFLKPADNYLRKQHFDERLTLGIPLQKSNSIETNNNHSYVSLEPEVHRQLPSKHSRITRSTDSFIAKSEPVVNQYKRYAISKLPSTSSVETQLLFKAIEKTEDLFREGSNIRTDSNVPKTDDTLNSVLVVV